jgi:SAM-dependent methyltransferase
MGDFAASWLALREPADRRARNPAIAAALRKALGPRDALRVTDLGCGTGANLRATAPLLGPWQHWTLIDNDAALLEGSADQLAAWADRAEPSADGLLLRRFNQTIIVAFQHTDLAGGVEQVLDAEADLITASAFFDLVSPDFIGRVAAATARHRAAFHTTLTYDGAQHWEPRHPADAAVIGAFNTHQRRDKGFGPAAGPDAPALLEQAFRAAGYSVRSGESPWRLEEADAALIEALAAGTAAAVAETGLVTQAEIAAWRVQTRLAATIGHVDTFAILADSRRS